MLDWGILKYLESSLIISKLALFCIGEDLIKSLYVFSSIFSTLDSFCFVLTDASIIILYYILYVQCLLITGFVIECAYITRKLIYGE